MISKILEFNKTTFFLLIISVMLIIVYFQQSYIFSGLLNNILDTNINNHIVKSKVVDIIGYSKLASLFFIPFVILARITFVSSSMFIVGILNDKYKTITFSDCYNIALKAEIIMVLYAFYSYYGLVYLFDGDSNLVLKFCSLLYFFDIHSCEPWFIIIVSSMNVFEIAYCLLLIFFYSHISSVGFIKSIVFIVSSYVVFYYTYIILMSFLSMYMK